MLAGLEDPIMPQMHDAENSWVQSYACRCYADWHRVGECQWPHCQ